MQVPDFDPHQSEREGGRDGGLLQSQLLRRLGPNYKTKATLNMKRSCFKRKKKQVIKGRKENGVKEKG